MSIPAINPLSRTSFAAVPSSRAAFVISNAVFWSPLITASANAFKSAIPVHLDKKTILFLLTFLKTNNQSYNLTSFTNSKQALNKTFLKGANGFDVHVKQKITKQNLYYL